MADTAGPFHRVRRVAALYDIHGNLPAFEAVLEDVRKARPDALLVGGDVFPGPMALDVLRALHTSDIPVYYIRGNGDRALVDTANGRESAGLPPALIPLFDWHVSQLERAEVDRVAAWPLTERLSVGALGDVLFCHATPRDDNEMFNAATSVATIAPAFGSVDAGIVICGHTHRQFDRNIGDIRVLNAGSVGMPLGGSDAEWLLLGDTVEMRRTAYDLDTAERRVRATDYPCADEFVRIAMRR